MKRYDKSLSTPWHDKQLIALLDKGVWTRLVNTYILPVLSDKWVVPYKLKEVTNIRFEEPVETKYKVVGYVDIVVDLILVPCPGGEGPHWHSELHLSIGCEIKGPTEPSLGAVTRQVKGYQFYMGSELGTWVVVSPFPEWKVPLESQGIIWIPASVSVLRGGER